MKKIVIVGWYGTETIGDRAILAGIIDIYCKIDPHSEFLIGSLYPFYTERSVIEDIPFINSYAKEAKIKVFDIHDKVVSKKIINSSDMIIMGGGPLTDILELDLIESAFKYARKKGKPTGLVGVGVGPITYNCYRKKIKNIIKLSSFIITRDIMSKKYILDHFGHKNVFSSKDPAILPTFHIDNNEVVSKNRIVINFREFPFGDGSYQKKINDIICDTLRNICETNIESEILLLSNHYFFIGGDDRDFYFMLKDKLNEYSNLKIQSSPMSLYDVIKTIKTAKICVGMRYHAILFQTFANGNNYILDYTDPKDGKTIGFIKDLDQNEFYNNRYFSLLECERNDVIPKYMFNNDRYKIDVSIYNDVVNCYLNIISNYLME